jgi:Domain of unknown function (DUF5664)
MMDASNFNMPDYAEYKSTVTAPFVNPYSDIIAKLRAIPADADGADLRAIAAEIRDKIPESTNPKDRIGLAKVSYTKVPAIAILHTAHAMMNGSGKYGPYNWREHEVLASAYVDAAHRHLDSWWEGEECAPDSGVHHLGHGSACDAILLDAQANGVLKDDRPKSNGAYARVLAELNAKILADRMKGLK